MDEFFTLQPESDSGSRSGSSLSLRNLTGDNLVNNNQSVQSPTHRRIVQRSISASSTNPSRRASSGGESLRNYNPKKALKLKLTDLN